MAMAMLSIVYLGIGWLVLPRVSQFVTMHQIVEKNYNDELIPNAMGIFIGVMLVVYLVLLSMMHVFIPFNSVAVFVNMTQFSAYLLALCAVCFVGWLDDTVGDKQTKGFAGHWQKWKKDKIMTTGWIKMWTTGALALWMCMLLPHATFAPMTWLSLHIVLPFLLMTLMTNAVNLLDVRPGRALKFYSLSMILLAVFGTHWTAYIIYALPVALCALILLRHDLRAKMMIGDTGANVLGFSLGYCLCIAMPIWVQIIIVMLLIGMHWIAAKSSITRLIADVKWLNWLDHLGR